ncbi:hypothetical protein BFU36_01595 [Sulfolobus sp. A20]|uniref:hypothetical protein n=1 Tax=Sulfolobaceae TaxID=118883 RepID=UPI000845D43C|nr:MULTISPECIES: hypothetical protein [unclassified Sulfolobus]TRM77328.1 hypothetical protein DJ528_06865 [Sulfolobus sp. B5]TRM78155.1 hypothetical protein DJ532_02005 [Sulfolobus sp. A20-N-F8]TRM84158.1 hypothetical protein DJ531_01965 [Sulfolobus sp. A20-N-F6]TRM88651.1 hypothetical protein DJ529_04540 [Sulfolobus sp. C3]TRM98517.1 hypothetical protein DJ530_10635 [Sulfolobus sp. E1]
MDNKYICSICGRTFPEGQGIKIEIVGEKLYFHSKSCAYKFLKEVILNSDSDCIGSSVKNIQRKYKEILEDKAKKAQKKI